MGGGSFTGTGALVRLILRRDRFLLPAWILFVPLVPVGQAAGIKALLTTPQAIEGFASTLRTPAIAALNGPLFAVNLGAMVVTRAGFLAATLGLVCVMVVIRHTRAEEQAGRRELLGSTVMGRNAALAAAVLVVTLGSVLLGVVLSLGLAAQGLSLGGSLAAGAAYASVGACFAAVGGLAAQLSGSVGGARVVGLSVLGVTFLSRMAGDLSRPGGSVLSWLSPLGWGQQLRPFADERWWVLLLPLGFVVVVVLAAFRLSAARDLGAGLLPSRSGPARAAPGFRSPLALAWRMHRVGLLGNCVAFVAIGLTLGSLGESISELLETTPQLREVFERLGGGRALVDAFFAGTMGFMALGAAAYAIGSALHLRREETEGHAEPVLATAVGRLRWAASHLVFAAVGPVVILLLAALAAAVAYGITTGTGLAILPRLAQAALAQLPAVWLLGGVAVALFGLVPSASGLAWGALAWTLLIGQVGAILRLDQWILDLSPFTHLPRLPGGAVTALPLLLLSVVAAALVAVGLAGLRRRDLQPDG